MTANGSNSAATSFGRQMKKMRESNGWTLRELAARTGIDFTTLSRIENGKRPPNAKMAGACDRAFPELRGWFTDFYDSSRTWMPPGFRDWPEIESRADTLRVWSPGIVHGLAQSPGYARALLKMSLGVTDDIVSARLGARMDRQRRMLERASVWFIVDLLALYRQVGSAQVMAEQCEHLVALAAGTNITVTVMPAIGHSVNAGEMIIADHAAYTEHAVGGAVFTDEQTVTRMAARLDTLRAESYRASESVAMIERLGGIWARGANPLTQTPAADRA